MIEFEHIFLPDRRRFSFLQGDYTLGDNLREISMADTLELYHAGLTSCSKKSRLCLKEKGLPYKSHYLLLNKFEHHGPAYLKLNPNGLVPTLVHNGTVIIESGVINEYLDEVFPDKPLRPQDPVARAKMRVFCKMADEYGLRQHASQPGHAPSKRSSRRCRRRISKKRSPRRR